MEIRVIVMLIECAIYLRKACAKEGQGLYYLVSSCSLLSLFLSLYLFFFFFFVCVCGLGY